MNIKRVILEEVNDFEWTDEVGAGEVHVGTCLKDDIGQEVVY